jgi:adenylate kinase
MRYVVNDLLIFPADTPAGAARQERKVRILLIAPPGAGKSTQGAVVARHYQIPHVATGPLILDHISRGTDVGRRAEPFVVNQDLVPDDILFEALRDPARKLRRSSKGFVLEGLPRTLSQARTAYHLGKDVGMSADVVVHIKMSDAVITGNLLRRYNRSSGASSAALVAKRLKMYHDETLPLIAWYAGRSVLAEVDGNNPVRQVATEMLLQLDLWRSRRDPAAE